MELHSLCLYFLSYQLEINTTAATTSNQMMNVNLSLLLVIKYTIAAIDQCQIERFRSSSKIVISTNSDVFAHSKIGD